MRIAAILASSIALLFSLVWLIYAPAFDSGVAAAASLAALCSSFFLKSEVKTKDQVQHVSGTAMGIQAGRDVKVRHIGNHK